MRKQLYKCLLALVVCLCASGLLYAQSAASASIVGRITDPQGAVVPGATVNVTNMATGITRTTKTTSDGLYQIPNLQPGNYDVVVESSGFSKATAKDIHLNVGDNRDLNFNMAVGSVSSVVEVTGQAPLIESTKSDVSSVLDEQDIEKLPVFQGFGGGANDYANLAVVAPGVKSDTSTISNGSGLGDLIGPGSINNRANLINVDGGNVIDQVDSGRDGLGASVDEVQEFQVLTNNYNAEYGQAGGLVMNVVTKSGTNSFHGTGYTYFRGRNLTASNFFYNNGLFQGTPLPGCKDVSNGVLTGTDGCPRAPFHRKEGGFTLGGPFVKDRVFWFVNFEDLQQAAPITITPPSGAVTVESPLKDLLYSAKLDIKLSAKNQLSARYNVERFTQANTTAQIGNNITPDSLIDQTNHNWGLMFSLVSTLSNSVVNEARFFRLGFVTSTTDKTTQPGQQYASFYTGANFLGPQGGWNHRYQFIDNLTWTKASHTFKAGFNISYYPWYSLFTQFHFGQYGDFAGCQGDCGSPESFIVGLGPGQVRSKDNIYGFYAQDTWKVTRRLTLNYGLRYDLEAGAFRGGPLGASNGSCLQGNALIQACSSDKNNFQPRVGFTYAIGDSGKTLVKGAFGEVTFLAYNNVVLDSLNFDGENLFTAVIDGSTPAGQNVLNFFPNFPSAAALAPFLPTPGIGPFGRVRPISNRLKNPEMRMVNFGIEHQFSKTLMGEVQYIGQFGYGLFGERDTNYPLIKEDPAHPGFFYFPQIPSPFPNINSNDRPDPRFTNIRTNENSRISRYNGLVLSATKRMSNHVQFQAGYTWSHLLTNGEDFFGLSEPGDPRNIKADYGPAFNDLRHAANFGVVLDTGKLLSTRLASWAINDLSFNFVGQIQSGRPYQVSTGAGPFSGERFFGTGNETQQRPNVAPDGTLTTTNIAASNGANLAVSQAGLALCPTCTQTTFLAPADASARGPVDSITGADLVDFQFVNGNLQRNAGLSPAFARLDFSLAKSFRFIPGHENWRAELRADFFNLFNHTNFLGNNANPSVGGCDCLDPTTGEYVGVNGKAMNISDFRLSRAQAVRDIQHPNFGGVGDPSIADIPRTIQLSFHIRF
ncbi:MAG TPA: TonB-dependent receptor [Terriglobales bacterium]|nr:TonB-dependent receptor [Terriglobales bacterium]